MPYIRLTLTGVAPALLLAILLSDATIAMAQSEPNTPVVPNAHSLQFPPAQSADAGTGIDQLLTRLILDNIPHNFEETKDWGDQTERWDGVKFHRDGLKIKTHRRKKLVNHGTWKKHSVELIDPDNQFSLQVKNMRETKNESLAFDVVVLAHLKIAARQSKWVKGVQLYSLSTRGHAHVRLEVSVELAVQMDPGSFPPDLVFAPTITRAELKLEDFRLDRISKAGGEFAQQLSRSMRSKIDEKVQDKNQKLVVKINSKLAKQKDKLRLSIADAIESKWTRLARPFLPSPVQDAIDH